MKFVEQKPVHLKYQCVNEDVVLIGSIECIRENWVFIPRTKEGMVILMDASELLALSDKIQELNE